MTPWPVSPPTSATTVRRNPHVRAGDVEFHVSNKGDGEVKHPGDQADVCRGHLNNAVAAFANGTTASLTITRAKRSDPIPEPQNGNRPDPTRVIS